MAESKGSLLAKSVSKHAGRAKEKLLQNLGKTASKSLLDSINEMYESQWTGHDLFYVQTQNIEMLWNDLSHKLGDQVLIPLNTYQAQFPEMRKKIDKRGRKLVDFDNCRHNLQALQSNASLKKKDEAKIIRAKEQLDEAKRTYDQLNTELHDELPALHESRVLFLVNNLQTLCSAEQLFHAETAKVYAEMEAIVDKLANDSQRNSYTLKKQLQPNSPPKTLSNSTTNVSAPSSPMSNDSLSTSVNNHSSPTAPEAVSIPPSKPVSNTVPSGVVEPEQNGHAGPPEPEPSGSSPPPYTANLMNGNGPSAAGLTNGNGPTNITSVIVNGMGGCRESGHVEQIYDIPSGATTDNLPAGVLYRVKATYKYTREDVDELSFDVGEIIRVVEYDDPEEQEEGWLMGIKESTGEKGMFPANFTRPL
ncbi:hypothetical protein M8J76_010370 [Diaphorina citri]|nr:hypothetical protein M8J75_010428 [Diaphorina citri]KAI5723746.1 hypothetical protein M8J76_010370 [Diaphorina citri]